MKIALVTNNKLHHKYWACEMNRMFDVKLIIIPYGEKNTIQKIKSKKIFHYGFFWFILKALSLLYHQLSKNSFSKRNKQYEKEYFSEYEDKFSEINENKIKHFETVNSTQAIKCIKDNEIDIICFLGGDIAGVEFIKSAKIITLNFHSGISPFYNGNKTIYHTFSDFRPNFAGGTLMVMNERIDGGEILSHYLVPLESNDSASQVFMKNIIGAVKLYSDAINLALQGQNLKGIKQKRTFKYVRNIDWTIINDIKINKFQDSKIINRYTRDEKIINYQKDKGDYTFSNTLSEILNNEK